MEVSEGQLARMSWYAKLSEPARSAYREASQRLLSLLKTYLTTNERETLLPEARRLGGDYYRLGKASRLSLSESVRAFLHFRDFLTESVMHIVEAAGPAPSQSIAELNQLTLQFTNEILIAMITAHETSG